MLMNSMVGMFENDGSLDCRFRDFFFFFFSTRRAGIQ